MKWFAYSILAIFILISFMPSVQAVSEDETNSIIDIDFQPYFTDSNTTVVNMADKASMVYEKDKVLGALPGIEGKYHGPYLESSLFEFAHEGGYFFFHTNFTIGPEVIMNGVSTFWIRVPVIPSQYEVWHLFTDWGYYNSIEGIQSGDASFGLLLPWIDHNLWYAFDYGSSSGNVWSTEAGDTYQIVERSTGLYVEYKGIFKPDEEFTLAFWGVLRSGQKAQVYLTQERVNPDQNQTFRFYEPYMLRDDANKLLDYGYRYDNNVSMQLEPAWAFLFTSGLGKDGMTSFKLKFRDDDDYLRWGGRDMNGVTWQYPVGGFYNDTHLSFYMPFSAICTSEEMGVSVIRNSVDWKVNITLNPASAYVPALSHWAEFNRSAYGLNHTYYSEFYVNNTSNYLLFSSPYPVSVNWSFAPAPTAPPYSIDVEVRLTPMQECEIVLLGNEIDEDDSFWSTLDVPYGHPLTAPYTKIGIFTEYLHEDEKASWDSDISVNAHWLPLFQSFAWTEGRWAKVNETKLYWTYDFGWGTAYSFPGEAQLYMFLDNGGEIFFNGSYAGFVDALEDKDKTFWERLFGNLIDVIGTVTGYIWDGIQWVWNTLVSIGNWIYTTVSEIVQWLISVIKDIAGKVSDVVAGMLYGMPMLVILFCATYYGEMLYKGKLPRMTKERRLFRKMVKKPAKKVYRVVKKQYKGYTSAKAKSLKDSEASRNADYRQRLRQERQREKWNVGETDYRRRSESIKRSQFDTKKGVSYGKYDEKTRRGKRVKWR